ncbi:VOC family protein [Neptunomonas qingdaonensis]|uniref:Catechol 2,3-dioxygenase n=1 Tax=Neptunomonas qingdaonensis TaxID=1045558 RepID=A0A1I2V228_9GAMM|nr:VOC family protein [Neptunomonas qingdaonensis]SFG83053.1 Catechol 2,3-dioxygenase [Neptunomonas qingdaonensis]
MHITKLDHVNIRTTQIDAMTQWYTEVLGLSIGPRPDFSFPGVWLYTGEAAVIHLVGVDRLPSIGADLKLEHFAFKATGAEMFQDRLRTMGIRFYQENIDSINQTQIHLRDPDNNHVHIDFISGE